MIRTYDPDRPVPAELVAAVVDAALRAPSAGFTQGVSLLMLADPPDRAAFWQVSAGDGESSWLRGMRTAPVVILVWTSREAYLERYAEPDKGWDDRDPSRWSAPYWFVDAGMAVMSGLLMAVDAGLGACFFGLPPDRQPDVRARFGVPGDQLSVGALTIGYPRTGPQPAASPARRPRLDPYDRVHRGAW